MSETSGAALPPGALLDAGRNRYQIGKCLGGGGFGIVYQAYDVELKRNVVIKEFFMGDCAVRHGAAVLPLSDTQRRGWFDKGLRAFYREACTLATFEHNNIVRIYNHFEANGTAYIVMPYLKGHELLHEIESRRFSEQEALAIIRPVLRGLKAVHNKGLLHLDIKPENIFLADIEDEPGPRPVLLDFGAARRSAAEVSHSLQNVLTPHYAPWEQYRKNGEVGPWSDIYALSATLYVLLGRKLPPDNGDMQRLDPTPLKKLNRDVSQNLSDLVMQGLARDYAQRPQSAEAFLQRLDSDSSRTELGTRPPGGSGSSVGGGYSPTEIQASEPLRLFFHVDSSGVYTGKALPLRRELQAGRIAAANNIVLNDPCISYKHARFTPLEHRPGWCLVTDLNSTNHIYYYLPSEPGRWQQLQGSVELPRGSFICLASDQAVIIELR